MDEAGKWAVQLAKSKVGGSNGVGAGAAIVEPERGSKLARPTRYVIAITVNAPTVDDSKITPLREVGTNSPS